jgi:hypothetical protein
MTFVWQGTWPFLWFSLMTGTHTFQFVPTASSTPELPQTYFLQEELFVGVLAGVFRLNFMKTMVRREFELLGANLKAWVENSRDA